MERARIRGISLSGYLKRCALDEQWVAEALQSDLPPALKVPVARHAIEIRSCVEEILDPVKAKRESGRLTRTYWNGDD